MKKYIISAVLVSYSHAAIASQMPLYFMPLTSRKDQVAYAKVHDEEFEVFSKKYLRETPSQKNADELLNQFELAQKYYLVKSMALAKEYYVKVSTLQDHDEWRDIHRKMIFLSLVRLSELESDHASEWLHKAISFSPDMDLKSFDFSEAQIDKLKDIKKEISSKAVAWSVQSLQKDFSYILLNGHVIDLSKFDNIKIPAGNYRITYLSDVYKPQTYQVTSQQIPFIEPSRIPFISGDCDHPQFNREAEDTNQLAVYYNENCVQLLQNNHWGKLIGAKLNGGEKIIPTESLQLEPSQNLREVAQQTLQTSVEEKPFYKKTWFWIITASVVAGTIIYASSQQKGSSEEPSHESVSF